METNQTNDMAAVKLGLRPKEAAKALGIGVRLLAGLTERAGGRKVFSVISEDNEGARKMAVRNRTRQVAEYFSARLGKRVGIWIPEWMLE